MRTDIDAVFTDFGGVLLHLDFERCFDTFHLLGNAERNTLQVSRICPPDAESRNRTNR